MNYVAPVNEQRFVLETVTGMGALGVESDLVDAVVAGAGQFAAGYFAPLNRIGDVVGAKWAAGRVVTPPGFREAYQAYVEGGWGSLDGPEEAGGQALPFALATVVLEDLGSANMAFALCPMLTVGAIEAIQTHGSDEQKRAYLPKLVSGEWTGTMNLTEPQAGSDVGALRTSATPASDGSWLINGSKIYITFGDHDLTENIVHLVLARTPDAPRGTKGISLFLVPKFRPDTDGNFTIANDVRCVSIEHKLGINASPTCTMAFGDGGDCRGWLIGPEMGGMRAMFTMMNNARLNVGLQGVQIGERATQAAIAYARDRVQGKPIIEHPDVRRMLMRMKALTQGARALIYAAAGDVDRAKAGDENARRRVEILTPLAKSWGTDVGCEVASLGIQVHGGMGFVEETGAAQHYRDIRIAPIYEGTNGIQAADLVGRKLALDGGSAIAELLVDIRADGANVPTLLALADAVERVVGWMQAHDSDDRLAGSAALLKMMAVATAASLLARQHDVAVARFAVGEGDPAFLNAKIATARFFFDHIVAEAISHESSACCGAAGLYALTDEELAA
ncbi:acyl-CoA dehydrogenase [Sphingomonas sp. SUN039]|uniref:acyl-CoA dehydrogenase n=1 Tax=Sphingomonas sp. SUN039 TaxID=2937787 RepID=UPI002164DF8D|nr:acyl-CoA dehydrogenase [Sphingomonas sp. SUN039]UVO52833.1 acyl-CoA dehydrogenase [Sphingomonas sp. SUN039]